MVKATKTSRDHCSTSLSLLLYSIIPLPQSLLHHAIIALPTTTQLLLHSTHYTLPCLKKHVHRKLTAIMGKTLQLKKLTICIEINASESFIGLHYISDLF